MKGTFEEIKLLRDVQDRLVEGWTAFRGTQCMICNQIAPVDLCNRTIDDLQHTNECLITRLEALIENTAVDAILDQLEQRDNELVK